MTVIAPEEPNLTPDCLRLSGAVVIDESYVHVTATLIENETAAVKWSNVFKWSRADSLAAPVEIAKKIVSALPVQFRNSGTTQVGHAT